MEYFWKYKVFKMLPITTSCSRDLKWVLMKAYGQRFSGKVKQKKVDGMSNTKNISLLARTIWGRPS